MILDQLSHSCKSRQIRNNSILLSKSNMSGFNILPQRPASLEVRAVEAPPMEELLQDSPFVSTFCFEDFDRDFGIRQIPPTPEINSAAEVQPVFYNSNDAQVVATLSVDENGHMSTNWFETEVCSLLFFFFLDSYNVPYFRE